MLPRREEEKEDLFKANEEEEEEEEEGLFKANEEEEDILLACKK